MKIPIFLSYPQPFREEQQAFISKIRRYLLDRGYEPRTLGVTDYDINEPLAAVRRLMLESNGVISVAFRRTKVNQGVSRPDNELGQPSAVIKERWLTSPWCHIEVAMAFQLGLPILIFREAGVIAEGVLERGVSGTYLPEFDLYHKEEDYFHSEQWCQIIGRWEGYVRGVVEYKGRPPRMF